MSQDLLFCLKQEGGGPGQSPLQTIGQSAKLEARAFLVGLLEDQARGRQHHALGVFGHERQQVPEEVHSAALPRGSKEHLGDRPGESPVGIGADQLDTGKAPIPEGFQELTPEGVVLALADGEAEHLPLVWTSSLRCSLSYLTRAPRRASTKLVRRSGWSESKSKETRPRSS